MEWGTFFIFFGIFLACLFACIFIDNSAKRLKVADKKREAFGRSNTRTNRMANERERINFVRYNSHKIPLIQELNRKYQFETFSQYIPLQKDCLSKQEYDNTNFGDILISKISENRKLYYTLLTKVAKNKKDYTKYSNELASIMDPTEQDKEYYSKYPYFYDTEKQIISEMKQHPVTSLNVHITKTYTSPQGRRKYILSGDYNEEALAYCYNESILNEKNQQECNRKTEKYKRSPISPGLRYDVMQRDGFKCVLCGATQEDGAKLEVDHILPVAKGGKNEMSNLRTLCFACNRGKRDKYDPYGMN